MYSSQIICLFRSFIYWIIPITRDNVYVSMLFYFPKNQALFFNPTKFNTYSKQWAADSKNLSAIITAPQWCVWLSWKRKAADHGKLLGSVSKPPTIRLSLCFWLLWRIWANRRPQNTKKVNILLKIYEAHLNLLFRILCLRFLLHTAVF